MLHREVVLLEEEAPPCHFAGRLLCSHHPSEGLVIGDQGEGVAEEIGPEMVGGPHHRQTFTFEGGEFLLGRVAGT